MNKVMILLKIYIFLLFLIIKFLFKMVRNILKIIEF